MVRCVCLRISAKEVERGCKWERGDRKEAVKRERQQGEQQGPCVQLSVEKRQLSIQLLRCLVPTSCFTLGWCGHGSKQSPLVLLAQCCFLCFTRGQGGTAACDYECLCARQICHRVQRDSQPASIRALNHESVYADRLNKISLLDTTQYSSQNSLL